MKKSFGVKSHSCVRSAKLLPGLVWELRFATASLTPAKLTGAENR